MVICDLPKKIKTFKQNHSLKVIQWYGIVKTVDTGEDLKKSFILIVLI